MIVNTSIIKPVVVVTGATRGMGLDLCKSLIKLKPDWNIVITGRDIRKGEEIVKNLNDNGHKNFIFHGLDVSDIDSIHKFTEIIKNTYSRYDILINNAAIYENIWNNEYVEKTMNINVRGPILLTNSILPLMKQQNYGKIINITSGYGKLNNVSNTLQTKLLQIIEMSRHTELTELWQEFEQLYKSHMNDTVMKYGSYSAYKLSKNLLNTFTTILAHILQNSGYNNIYVNAIDPGWVKTDMGGAYATRSISKGNETTLWLTQLEKEIPTGSVFYDMNSYLYKNSA